MNDGIIRYTIHKEGTIGSIRCSEDMARTVGNNFLRSNDFKELKMFKMVVDSSTHLCDMVIDINTCDRNIPEIS